MSDLLKIAENLLLDLARERWLCEQCGHDLGHAREDVKRGLLVGERDPSEVHPPLIEGEYTFAPNPAYWSSTARGAASNGKPNTSRRATPSRIPRK